MPCNTDTTTCPAGQGSLPSCAGLAVPYVPFQGANPQRYDRMEALEEGTLFPGLNLPFHVLVDGKPLTKDVTTQLQGLCFVLQELGLYLDTHPQDEEAFALFQRYTALMEQAHQTYAQQLGPVLRTDAAQGSRFTWVDGPWPWGGAADSEEA